MNILPAEQVGESDGNTSPKQGITGEHESIVNWPVIIVDFTLKNNSHNNTINGNSLTKNNTYITKINT
jgi:hypothetical protein